MREACEPSAVARRGAGRSRHSGPRCSIGARRRVSHPTALAWAVGRRVREAVCAAVYVWTWAASATERAALFETHLHKLECVAIVGKYFQIH